MLRRSFISFLLVLLVCPELGWARELQQQPGPSNNGQGPSNNSSRVLRRSFFRQRGQSPLEYLGRDTVGKLRRNSRFRGTDDDLSNLINTDGDLNVDTVNSRLVYECAGLAPNASAAEIASATGPSAVDPTVTREQAMSLSSRPGAARRILLDFDGQVTTGTGWNLATGRSSITTPPYDKDGNPSSFSEEELSDIVSIWRQVAEDFAMFDVDVTTIDTGDAALANGIGVRVLIGGSYTDWWNNAAGGIAYVGGFGNGNPCFVFSQNLGPNYAKFVGEAVSHEVGHTLGLTHDGTVATATTTASNYYAGQGDWAPIMGASYSKAVTTFDKGEYAISNNNQDDLATIAGYLPPLPEENGINATSATPLVPSVVDLASGAATANATGVVSSANGDWFSFSALAGTAVVAVSVVAPLGDINRANLDVQLTVYDANMTVLAVINPPGATAATLGVPATALNLTATGNYTVWIAGAGAGDPATNGYSSYASRGQFALTVTYPCVNCSADALRVAVASPAPSAAPPSPSPSPAPLLVMRVASITMSRLWTSSAKTAWYCTGMAIVRDAAGTTLAGAKLTGVWSVVPVNSLYASADVKTTSAAGTANVRSLNVPAGAATACVYNVSSVELAGYQLNPSFSQMSRVVTV